MQLINSRPRFRTQRGQSAPPRVEFNCGKRFLSVGVTVLERKTHSNSVTMPELSRFRNQRRSELQHQIPRLVEDGPG